MNKREIKNFQKIVWDFYTANQRAMPWREDTRPYYILVSEIMLQQTQVSRVIPKFRAFIEKFPDFRMLAKAPLAEVLAVWIGLGYNRRARFLHMAAQRVMEGFGGELPNDKSQLESLPGIGPNTAGAILAYSFNQPVVFIETNIRTVYLHHFFADASGVDDKEIGVLLGAMLDTAHPREWYWALMDYGSHLKASQGSNISRSRHYKRQSPLKGSLREMRGEIIRQLHEKSRTVGELETVLRDPRLSPALEGLKRDGLVSQAGSLLHLTGARQK